MVCVALVTPSPRAGLGGVPELCLTASSKRRPSHHPTQHCLFNSSSARTPAASPPPATPSQPKTYSIESHTMADANVVDETPISPVRAGIERRNSLEKHLQHRPDVQDLKNRHILLDTSAAPYVQPLLLPQPRHCHVSAAAGTEAVAAQPC